MFSASGTQSVWLPGLMHGACERWREGQWEGRQRARENVWRIQARKKGTVLFFWRSFLLNVKRQNLIKPKLRIYAISCWIGKKCKVPIHTENIILLELGAELEKIEKGEQEFGCKQLWTEEAYVSYTSWNSQPFKVPYADRGHHHRVQVALSPV